MRAAPSHPLPFLSPRAVPQGPSELTQTCPERGQRTLRAQGAQRPIVGSRSCAFIQLSFFYTSTMGWPWAGVLSALAWTKASGVRRGTSKHQSRKGFLRKATWISKPGRQDLIDFGFCLFVLNSLFIVHLLKSSQSHSLEQNFSTTTVLTFGTG